MKLIETIRKKSNKEKIRLIWIICIIVAVILIMIWIFTSKIGQDLPKDIGLFQTIKNGVNNLK